jgi:hypothetical protein
MSKAIQLPREMGDGKDREIQVLFADRWRKLVLIQLRRGVLLADLEKMRILWCLVPHEPRIRQLRN